MEKINTYCKLLARKFRIKLVRYQITTFKLSFGPTGLLLVGFLLILWGSATRDFCVAFIVGSYRLSGQMIPRLHIR